MSAAEVWAGDGVPARVIGHDRPCAGIAVLTLRPWARLPHRPGQAVPVQTPRHPGRWRWYSPANAPRPDGTVELHVRAVAAGTVSGGLVQDVRPGDLLRLGPARDTGLHLRDGDLLLVAGGTGLAPLRALVEQVAATPGRTSRCTSAGRPPWSTSPAAGCPSPGCPRAASTCPTRRP
ncbi:MULTISPECIES: FAD-binding oxidoreductase [unclassified Micromonospora]|uniref:FAD-binding oxidoreductase n=1 Tax=unclassified Micromonospora TaxID=2617518 RepID=UPI00241743A6|nr:MULTISPECIES: FAD-binding oxidoreductase [unclassified Micromonospora]MDG4817697.1 FAD-binding oxidoreductase [Micromonospora sp. WMMD956]WFE60288.1 FAD-binding oxidoreductase [Micromonospora sp. WMMD712]